MVRSSSRSTLDDVIVGLHLRGETVFQAMARIQALPGVDRLDPALLTEVPEGRVPLANGRTVDQPRLDAAGVAAICTHELELASYTADRVLVTEPTPPKEPRIESGRLWPALRAAGFRVGPALAGIGPRFTPRRLLAERTGIHLRTIDRICSGTQKTISVTTGITILEELPPHPVLDELTLERDRWDTAMSLYHYDRFEYLEKLGRLAQPLLALPAATPLTPEELMALNDVLVLLRAAHREPSPEEHVLTAGERLETADRWFRETLDRDPTPLSPRLRSHTERIFRADRDEARSRRRRLHRGLEAPAITTRSAHQRTYRLRRAGRLPAKSKPRAFQPPADFLDIAADRP